jgi:hypothetical protein
MAAGAELEIKKHVAFLKSPDASKRRRAVNALIELTYDNPKNRVLVGKMEGAILSLIDLLEDARAQEKSGIACLLGNLALNNASNARYISTEVCLSTLITLLDDANIDTATMAAWALANTAWRRGDAQRIREKNGIKLLHDHLKGDLSPEGREAVERAITQLQRVGREQRVASRGTGIRAERGRSGLGAEAVATAQAGESEIIRHVALLRSRDAITRGRAAMSLWNLAVFDDYKVLIGRTKGAIVALKDLLRDDDYLVKKYAAGALKSLAINPSIAALINTEKGRVVPAATASTYTPTTSFRESGGGGSSPTYAPEPASSWVWEVPKISDAEAYEIRERMEFDARVQESIRVAAEEAEREAEEKAEERAAARKKEIAEAEERYGTYSSEASTVRQYNDHGDSSICVVM